MKKFLLVLLVLFIVAVGGIVAAKDQIIKFVIETGVTTLTGFKTTLGSLSISPSGVIQLKDLKILNPSEFKQEVFTEIPEIYLSIDVPALFKGVKIHLPEIRLNIQQVNLEKNAQGITNVQKLTSIVHSDGATKPVQPSPPSKQPALSFQVDRLVLTLRKISYQDFSGGLGFTPKNVSVDLNVDQEVFQNVQDPKAIVALILSKILYGTTFGNLLNIDAVDLQNTLKNTLGTGTELLNKTTDEVTAVANDLLNTSMDQTKELLKPAQSLTSGGGDLLKKTTSEVSSVAGELTGGATSLFKKLKAKTSEITDSSVNSGTATSAQ